MRSSLGVRLDLVQVIFMALDREIESPVQADSRLPKADGFIVFLGTKRRVVEIPLQEQELLEKRLLNRGRGGFQTSQEAPRVNNAHQTAKPPLRARFRNSVFMDRTASRALANGPWVRPCLKSSRLSAIPRSTSDLGVNVILPRSTLASSKSPTCMPTCSRRFCGRTT